MRTVIGTTCSTRHGTFVAVGRREGVLALIIESAGEEKGPWANLIALNDEMKERRVTVRRSEIVMVGDEQELEIPDPEAKKPVAQGHVQLKDA